MLGFKSGFGLNMTGVEDLGVGCRFIGEAGGGGGGISGRRLFSGQEGFSILDFFLISGHGNNSFVLTLKGYVKTLKSDFP